jgi:RNase P protein component
MTPAPRSRPIRGTLEPQETLSFEDIACLLRTSSENEKMVFSEDSPSSDDMIPSNVDVLCGRDREAHVHVGNKKFRVMISWYRDKYQNAKCRHEKTRITKEIVSSIHECGGRFLKKDENTEIWYDVGDEYAHEKVSHALRSAKDPEKKIRPIRKPKVPNQPPTPEENHAFQTLLENQKRIFRSLLEEDKASCTLDFEEDEHCLDSLLSEDDEYYWGSLSV